MRQMIIIPVIMIMLLIFSIVSKSHVDSNKIVTNLLTIEEMKNIKGGDVTTCNAECNNGALTYTFYGGCFYDDCEGSPLYGRWCCPNGTPNPTVQFTPGTCTPLQGSTCTTSTFHIYQIVDIIINQCWPHPQERCKTEYWYTIDEDHDSCGHAVVSYTCLQCT